MGCNSSSPKEDAAAVAREKQAKRDAANAAMNAPKLDPRDFMLTGLSGQTIVREPGSIKGQQFIIEECTDCDIYLLDHTATVAIDDCKDCRIFVGPCESSVFIRTSKNLKLIIAAQQLRTRECSDLDILLYVSAGQPVIESTSRVRLGCFQFNYFGLAEQFAAAGLDPWYSEWSNVHDFTASAGNQQWSFIDSAMKGSDLLKPLDVAKPGLENIGGFVTPTTWGNRPAPIGSPIRFLVAIAPGQHDSVGFDLLETHLGPLLTNNQAWLVRSRRVDLAKPIAKAKVAGIFHGSARKAAGQAQFATRVAEKDAGTTLGFEVMTSQEHLNQVQASLQAAAIAHPNAVYVSDPADSKQSLELFFENLAVM